ncbi:hypothetical protein [[Pseudomonas] boreopolis]|uniref:Uncharacterized protein n=1 Tax=Xanthomonas boreopolis TaxID=86183 RepID=A0A919F770_9XANT|nr:hypothetical protein GCM10009090_16360 [[Pseudomonas] boreopolis]
MIQPEQLREYHRNLALHALGAAGECSAAELLEQMGSAAMFAGHPAECWRGLTTPMVAGLLRELDGDRLVERRNNRHNSKQGRPEPIWGLRPDVAVGDALPAVPRAGAAPVELAEPRATLPLGAYAGQPSGSRQGGLTEGQRLALLQVEFEEMQARMAAEWQTFRARAARVLNLGAEVG